MNTDTSILNVRSREELIAFVAEHGNPKYTMFWGHTPKVRGQVDKSCFSNWFPCEFKIEGVCYATTEHYMMAGKARLFDDSEALEKILIAKSPGEAKKLGRLVKKFDPAIWSAHCMEIVIAGNVGKFGQHLELKNFLLATGSRVLVEASPRDRIWGIGMGQNNPAAEDPNQWRGRNLLGFALMETRQRLSNNA